MMKSLHRLRSIISFLFMSFVLCTSKSLTDVTDKLFSDTTGGIIAAFGDFNVDKLTDIFTICNGGQQVDLLVAQSREGGYERKTLIPPKKNRDINSVITSVVPGDFDGDVQMDVLVTRKVIGVDNSPVSVDIYWGNSSAISVSQEPLHFDDSFPDEPTLLDWNADMLPDLLTEDSQGNRSIWLARDNRTFEKIPFPKSPDASPMTAPHSNAFLDLDGDGTADLLITSRNVIEVWINVEGTLTYNHTITLPTLWVHTGQITAVDIDQDSFLDLLVPACETADCSTSAIYVYTYKDKQWQKMAKDFSSDGKSWVFPLPDSVKLNVTLPITLRAGDFDMDGYPDVVVVLQHTQEGATEYRAVLLLNTACDKDETFCGVVGRKFVPEWTSGLDADTPAVSAAFFDLYENGILDVLLVTVPSLTQLTPQIKAFRNDLSADAYFVKVTVGSGRKCPPGRKPYSVNQAGATIKYTTISTDRSTQESSATQLSQSAHFALQLPYTVFGLGQTPNFVDTLSVGIPRPVGSTNARVKEWTQIIPNSQMMVVPYPNDTPSMWVLKLSLTPSHLVMMTGAVLVGTCGFVAVIVSILHWREKREDREEKRLDAHKFHFDAM